MTFFSEEPESNRQLRSGDVPVRIAVLDDYQEAALSSADWTSLRDRASIEVFRDHLSDEQDVVDRLKDFDIVVAMRERTPFPASLLSRLPRLRLLVTTGPSNAAIDLEAAAAMDVAVCGTNGIIPPTTEMTWALILACVKQVPANNDAVRAGRWQTLLAGDLHGKRLGILGLGRFGALVAEVGRAFGMEVIAWSQNLTEERCSTRGVTLVTKDALFADSDVLSVHLVLSERTKGLVGERELRMMRPTSYFVNTSRGPVVDESALVRALRENWIAGAGLDVFDVEPLPSDHPFLALKNVVLTPHIGYVTSLSYQVFFGDVVEDIVSFLDGSVLRPVEPRNP